MVKLDATNVASEDIVETESYAWKLRIVADRIQKRICNDLQLHCNSLHGSVQMLRKHCYVDSDLAQHLTQLNACETLLKHGDNELLKKIEAKVSSILVEHKQTSGREWVHLNGSNIYLDSLVAKPFDTTGIVAPPPSAAGNDQGGIANNMHGSEFGHTSDNPSTSRGAGLDGSSRDVEDVLPRSVVDPWSDPANDPWTKSAKQMRDLNSGGHPKSSIHIGQEWSDYLPGFASDLLSEPLDSIDAHVCTPSEVHDKSKSSASAMSVLEPDVEPHSTSSVDRSFKASHEDACSGSLLVQMSSNIVRENVDEEAVGDTNLCAENEKELQPEIGRYVLFDDGKRFHQLSTSSRSFPCWHKVALIKDIGDSPKFGNSKPGHLLLETIADGACPSSGFVIDAGSHGWLNMDGISHKVLKNFSNDML